METIRNIPRLIHYYARLYRGYISVCAAQALSFRLHFLLLIIVDLFFYASSFGTVSFIFGHVDAIGPWNRHEFLFFVAFILAVDQLHMSLFTMAFWEFSADLRLGRLDFWLVKPANIIFIVFFRHIRFATLLLVPLVWSVLIYLGLQLHLSITDWIILPGLVLTALTLLVTIEICLSAAMFWTIESVGINFLRMQIQSVGRWPDFVYQYLFRKIFTVFVPILLVASTPVHVLLDSKPMYSLLVLAGVIVALWGVIGLLWRAGLHQYESASS
jgi:ABC-2 type transport system permease protein